MKPFLTLAGALALALSLTACGDDLPEDDDTTWITTVDPVTGVRLSCFVADGTYAMVMHCLEVAP